MAWIGVLIFSLVAAVLWTRPGRVHQRLAFWFTVTLWTAVVMIVALVAVAAYSVVGINR